nr:ATP-binding protein [Neobacillus sp. Marseille-Q6967]
MRDIVTLQLNSEESLIIASDNSGGIGLKELDHVHVSYEIVGYYSFRVAAMECIAGGGNPVSVVLHNFCGNGAWTNLVKGIQRGFEELKLDCVPVTGSTESNFDLQQSAIGLLVIGKKPILKNTEIAYSEQLKYAVIGLPLVGNEVIEYGEHIVPLSVFLEISKLSNIMTWPVGSKGILYEFNQMFTNREFTKNHLITKVDVLKSSGPATCFIVAFHPEQEEEIKRMSGSYFYAIEIIR